MDRRRFKNGFCLGALVAWAAIPARAAEALPDGIQDPTIYTVGYSHLDTQWRWSYPQVIREFIPNTINENGALFDQFPHYTFNWTGAFRYRLMQEYHPEGFARVRKWVKQGRWFPCGSSWEECDANIPAAESIVRQILYGHNYFKQEFGIESSEFMLPDSFGFPASLPSILAHCGLRGFSTQKLTWGSAVGIPFTVGRWEGLDGNSVVAVLNSGDYNGDISGNLATDPTWEERLRKDFRESGLPGIFQMYGVGDRGGSPRPDSVKWVEASVTTPGPVRVLSARADQFFHDITPAQRARLPVYRGDLLLTEHSAGSLTSQAYMKQWHRANELLADAAERASAAAHLLGAVQYPTEKLRKAWQQFLAGEMHDVLPGTAVPKAYEYAWNDQIIALNSFAAVLQNAVGGVALALDTRGDGIPLVVYNPLSVEREDVVEAEVKLDLGAGGVVVRDGRGQFVPSQILATNGRKVRLAFLARVPSVGFAVFHVVTGQPVGPSAELSITERSLENMRYRITVDDHGDLSHIFDKKLGRELLRAPARLAFLEEVPQEWPAWNMDWKDRVKPPIGYVDGPAKIQIIENGPARVALAVTRAARNSLFTQTIRLAGGTAGNRIELRDQIDWQSKRCSLKAEFPLALGNQNATYNLDVGKIQRGGNEPTKYEVPSHQWFDLTDAAGAAGVSILTGAKYGSDKPADDVIRLTLLYTPGLRFGGGGYREQQTQDWGLHDFTYGIASHAGDGVRGASDWQAARMEQPLRAFQTAKHAGSLGREFSLLKLASDRIAVRAIKLAENGNDVVIRLQELSGTPQVRVELKSAARILAAQPVNGVEVPLASPIIKPKLLELDFKPYELRTLALTLRPVAKLRRPPSIPVRLPFNSDAFSWNSNRFDGAFDDQARTIPAELIPDQITAEGIEFAVGPRDEGALNVVVCQGQVLQLPAGKFDRIYLLASAALGDQVAEFKLGPEVHAMKIQPWSGPIGLWDNRVFEGQVSPLTYSLNNRLLQLDAGFIKRDVIAWYCSHRHSAFEPGGRDEEYAYSYLFKYSLPLKAGVKTLTLPRNPHIGIFAVSVALDPSAATVPSLPLYDDFTGRSAPLLRTEID